MLKIASYEEYREALRQQKAAFAAATNPNAPAGDRMSLSEFNALSKAIWAYERNENPETPVEIFAALGQKEAMALAQLAKRLTWDDARRRATSDSEAYLMMDAIVVLQKALGDVGYSPR